MNNLTPITRKEFFMATAAGQDVTPPEPITREEMFWADIIEDSAPTETWETIYENSINAIEDDPYPYFWFGTSISSIVPEVGETWRVTFDGVEYRCVATDQGAYGALLGNPKWSGFDDDGSGMPFSFFNAGWGAWSGGCGEMGTYAVKLERLVTE